MIPKKAHVIWLGGQEIPQKESYFIDKNKYVLKDYEFKIWNDDEIKELIALRPNLKNFSDYAFSNKIWAQLADLAKLLILEKHGGWTFDTDNQFIKPPDDHLNYNWVSGFENYAGRLMPITAVMAAVPEHKFTKYLITAYDTEWISNMLLRTGVKNDNSKQYIDILDLTLLPYSVFCATGVQEETVSFHHFSGLWIPNNEEVKRKL
jgi:mannosyltransferase OCH1-like enzyme